MEELANRLRSTYGPMSQLVFDVFLSKDPLSYAQSPQATLYWKMVSKFMDELHYALYNKDFQFSLSEIKPQNYYFLIKCCIDRSFDVTDFITIRNQKDRFPLTEIANKICHGYFHDYIVYLRQIKTHIHEGMSSKELQLPQPALQQQALQPTLQQQLLLQQLQQLYYMPPIYPFIFTGSQQIQETKKVKPKPHVVFKQNVKPPPQENTIETDGTIPLNMYTVYNPSTTGLIALLSKFNNTPEC